MDREKCEKEKDDKYQEHIGEQEEFCSKPIDRLDNQKGTIGEGETVQHFELSGTQLRSVPFSGSYQSLNPSKILRDHRVVADHGDVSTQLTPVFPACRDVVDGIRSASSRSRSLTVLPAIIESTEESEYWEEDSPPSSCSSSTTSSCTHTPRKRLSGVFKVSSRPVLTSISEEFAVKEQTTRRALSEQELDRALQKLYSSDHNSKKMNPDNGAVGDNLPSTKTEETHPDGSASPADQALDENVPENTHSEAGGAEACGGESEKEFGLSHPEGTSQAEGVIEIATPTPPNGQVSDEITAASDDQNPHVTTVGVNVTINSLVETNKDQLVLCLGEEQVIPVSDIDESGQKDGVETIAAKEDVELPNIGEYIQTLIFNSGEILSSNNEDLRTQESVHEQESDVAAVGARPRNSDSDPLLSEAVGGQMSGGEVQGPRESHSAHYSSSADRQDRDTETQVKGRNPRERDAAKRKKDREERPQVSVGERQNLMWNATGDVREDVKGKAAEHSTCPCLSEGREVNVKCGLEHQTTHPEQENQDNWPAEEHSEDGRFGDVVRNETMRSSAINMFIKRRTMQRQKMNASSHSQPESSNHDTFDSLADGEKEISQIHSGDSVEVSLDGLSKEMSGSQLTSNFSDVSKSSSKESFDPHSRMLDSFNMGSFNALPILAVGDASHNHPSGMPLDDTPGDHMSSLEVHEAMGAPVSLGSPDTIDAEGIRSCKNSGEIEVKCEVEFHGDDHSDEVHPEFEENSETVNLGDIQGPVIETLTNDAKNAEISYYLVEEPSETPIQLEETRQEGDSIKCEEIDKESSDGGIGVVENIEQKAEEAPIEPKDVKIVESGFSDYSKNDAVSNSPTAVIEVEASNDDNDDVSNSPTAMLEVEASNDNNGDVSNSPTAVIEVEASNDDDELIKQSNKEVADSEETVINEKAPSSDMRTVEDTTCESSVQQQAQGGNDPKDKSESRPDFIDGTSFTETTTKSREQTEEYLKYMEGFQRDMYSKVMHVEETLNNIHASLNQIEREMVHAESEQPEDEANMNTVENQVKESDGTDGVNSEETTAHSKPLDSHDCIKLDEKSSEWCEVEQETNKTGMFGEGEQTNESVNEAHLDLKGTEVEKCEQQEKLPDLHNIASEECGLVKENQCCSDESLEVFVKTTLAEMEEDIGKTQQDEVSNDIGAPLSSNISPDLDVNKEKGDLPEQDPGEVNSYRPASKVRLEELQQKSSTQEVSSEIQTSAKCIPQENIVPTNDTQIEINDETDQKQIGDFSDDHTPKMSSIVDASDVTKQEPMLSETGCDECLVGQSDKMERDREISSLVNEITEDLAAVENSIPNCDIATSILEKYDCNRLTSTPTLFKENNIIPDFHDEFISKEVAIDLAEQSEPNYGGARPKVRVLETTVNMETSLESNMLVDIPGGLEHLMVPSKERDAQGGDTESQLCQGEAPLKRTTSETDITTNDTCVKPEDVALTEILQDDEVDAEEEEEEDDEMKEEEEMGDGMEEDSLRQSEPKERPSPIPIRKMTIPDIEVTMDLPKQPSRSAQPRSREKKKYRKRAMSMPLDAERAVSSEPRTPSGGIWGKMRKFLTPPRKSGKSKEKSDVKQSVTDHSTSPITPWRRNSSSEVPMRLRNKPPPSNRNQWRRFRRLHVMRDSAEQKPVPPIRKHIANMRVPYKDSSPGGTQATSRTNSSDVGLLDHHRDGLASSVCEAKHAAAPEVFEVFCDDAENNPPVHPASPTVLDLRTPCAGLPVPPVHKKHSHHASRRTRPSNKSWLCALM